MLSGMSETPERGGNEMRGRDKKRGVMVPVPLFSSLLCIWPDFDIYHEAQCDRVEI